MKVPTRICRLLGHRWAKKKVWTRGPKPGEWSLYTYRRCARCDAPSSVPPELVETTTDAERPMLEHMLGAAGIA